MTHSTSKLVGPVRAAIHMSRRGLTLVEIMVVIAILGLLMGVIAFNVVASADEADVEACKLQIGQIEKNLNLHRASNKTFPTTSEGLEAAQKYFPDGVVPKDPWGNDFQYTSDEMNTKSFRSAKMVKVAVRTPMQTSPPTTSKR